MKNRNPPKAGKDRKNLFSSKKMIEMMISFNFFLILILSYFKA